MSTQPFRSVASWNESSSFGLLCTCPSTCKISGKWFSSLHIFVCILGLLLVRFKTTVIVHVLAMSTWVLSGCTHTLNLPACLICEVRNKHCNYLTQNCKIRHPSKIRITERWMTSKSYAILQKGEGLMLISNSSLPEQRSELKKALSSVKGNVNYLQHSNVFIHINEYSLALFI